MTLDDLLRLAVDDTRTQINGLTPPSVRSRRRWLQAAVGTAAVLAIAVGMVAVWRWVAPPDHPTAGPATYLAPGETLLMEDPLVVLGAASVEPRFDPSGIGEEVILGPVTDLGQFVGLGSIVGGIGLKIIVIGVIGDEEPVALVYSEVDDPEVGRMRVRSVVGGGGIASAGSLVQEVINEPGGLPGPGRDTPGATWTVGGPDIMTVDPLPEGTSVVVFTINGVSLWQRPRGGVAAFPTDFRGGDEFTLTVLDAEGRTIVHQTISEATEADTNGRPRFCEVSVELEALGDLFSLPPEQARPVAEEFFALMTEARAVAPDAIRTQIDDIALAYIELYPVYEAAGFDSSKLDQAAIDYLFRSEDERLAALGIDEIPIEQWLQTNCQPDG